MSTVARGAGSTGGATVADTLRRCLRLLPADMRGRWAALIPLLLLTALLEAASAASIFGLVRILTDPAQAATLPVARTVLRWLPPLDARNTVMVMAGLVGLLYAVKNGLGALSAWAQARCVNDATAATSVALLRAYLSAPWSFHLQRNAGGLVYDVHEAVQRIYRTVAAPALGIVTETLVALAIVAVLFAAAPQVTLIAVGVLVALSLLLLRVTRGSTVRVGARYDRLSATALGRLQQTLAALKELKVLGREQGPIAIYAEDRRVLADAGTRYGMITALPRLAVEAVFVCGALLVVILLTARGSTAADTMPLLGLYAYAGFRVIPSANRMIWMISEIRHGSSAVARIHADLMALQPTPTAAAAAPWRDAIAFEQVSFTPPGGERPLLREIDLTVRRGEWVGLMGPTGAGKSTLVDLAVGLLAPNSGRITVDGIDLHTCTASWQRCIGYVPQTVALLDDTLRRNVALGVPDAEIDDGRVREALRRAQLGVFLDALPEGLDTRVGDTGMRLSGGERQRVGIARALYCGPLVLVFDEATSALDETTERALIDSLRELPGDLTMLIVAHRATTVQHCHRVVILRGGTIEREGGAVGPASLPVGRAERGRKRNA